MNRELLVTLIRKNIDELIMLTEGFMEMDTYPAAIINLAKNKTDDIWSYINQLGNLKPEELQQITERMSVATEMTINTGKEDISETKEFVSNEKTTEEEDIPVYNNTDKEDVNTFDEEEFSEEEEEEEEENDDDDDDDDIIFEQEEEEIKEEEEVTEPIEENEVIADNKDDIEITEDVITVEFTETIEKEETITSDVEKVITTTETVEKKVTLAEKISGNGISRNEMMARGENGGINTAIGSKKVDDIRQAISLGDRFRFQRELFKNNGEEMNKTLSYINKLATYEEVIGFLQSKYGWEENNAAAEDFYQIIKRKF